MIRTGRPFLLMALACGGASLFLGTPPVRADAPAGRYTVSGTGASATVFDTKTRLRWQQTVPATTYTWADAKTYCASAAVSLALGGTGWRLPTVKELLTIVDVTQPAAPFIDPVAFSGTPSGFYWSSTPDTNSINFDAWIVDFYTSHFTATDDDTNSNNLRCVR